MRSYVSDEAVEAIISELSVTREKRRAIQKMSREELQRYLVGIFRAGFNNGADAIQRHLATKAEEEEETEEVSIGWEDVLEVIATVKGIGPKTIRAIDERLKETY